MARNKDMPPMEDVTDVFDDPVEELEAVTEELVDGLTAEERAEIEAEAETLIEKERKDRAKKDFKTKAIAEARRRANWSTEGGTLTVHIDLPGHAECITINGIKYYHGGTYTVPRDLGTFLLEKQQRCWQHEHQIGGTSKEVIRERNLKIGIKDIGIPAASILHG